jgi:hypothetical protein
MNNFGVEMILEYFDRPETTSAPTGEPAAGVPRVLSPEERGEEKERMRARFNPLLKGSVKPPALQFWV